jgi:outer membrane murein-binding lipoprotein Lpp
MSKYSEEMNSLGCFAILAVIVFCIYLGCTAGNGRPDYVQIRELKSRVDQLEAQVDLLQTEVYKLQEQREEFDARLDDD